jgi:hypothetical protein
VISARAHDVIDDSCGLGEQMCVLGETTRLSCFAAGRSGPNFIRNAWQGE